MKKLGITIIIVALAIGAFAGSFYISSRSNEKVVTASENNSTLTNGSGENNSNIGNNADSNAGANNINEENTNNSNQGISTNNEENQVNWNFVNSSQVLTSEEQSNFLSDLANVAIENENAGKVLGGGDQYDLDKLAGDSFKRYENVVNNIVSTIQGRLTGQALINFNEEVSNFNEFNQDSVLALYPNTSYYSMLPMQQAFAAETYEMNMAYYLVFAYGSNNGTTNPQLGPYLENNYISNLSTDKTFNKFEQSLENVTYNSDNLITNMDVNNPKEVLNTYNNIYRQWTNEIDTIYDYIKTNSGGYISPRNLVPSEIKWIDFKNQQIALAGQGLTGISKEIAEKRMAIQMTQLQSYNLAVNLSSSVGLDL